MRGRNTHALFLSLARPFMTNDTRPLPSLAVCSSADGTFIHMAVPEGSVRESCMLKRLA